MASTAKLIRVHGQKKRRKRSLEGSLVMDGIALTWQLRSEPLWSNEHGYKGMCISVRQHDAQNLELILEFPFPRKGQSYAPLPQRPEINDAVLEGAIRLAVLGGWAPDSRGKAFHFQVP